MKILKDETENLKAELVKLRCENAKLRILKDESENLKVDVIKLSCENAKLRRKLIVLKFDKKKDYHIPKYYIDYIPNYYKYSISKFLY